jgi:hypothetical protein
MTWTEEKHRKGVVPKPKLFVLASKSSGMKGGETKRVVVVHGKPGSAHSFSGKGLIIKRICLYVCIQYLCSI